VNPVLSAECARDSPPHSATRRTPPMRQDGLKLQRYPSDRVFLSRFYRDGFIFTNQTGILIATDKDTLSKIIPRLTELLSNVSAVSRIR
jgi:hypothetical protein